MTEFGKALENVKRYLFWDFVGDRMLDTPQTPLDRDYFNRLMSVLVEAHDADIAKYDAENVKLRKLCKRMFKDFVSCDYELRARAGRTFMAFTRYVLELQELGIEVDK